MCIETWLVMMTCPYPFVRMWMVFVKVRFWYALVLYKWFKHLEESATVCFDFVVVIIVHTWLCIHAEW